MKKIFSVAIAMMAGFVLSTAAYGFASKSSVGPFSPDQKQAIEKIVHDYLVNNPEVLIEASQALQAKELSKVKSQALEGITKNKAKLFSDTMSPTAGNPNGDVILVMFFDYQCSHCKEMQPIIEKVMATHPNIKIIYKEFPIFGANSNYAAQMALAAAKQNKYVEFHNALLKVQGPLSEEKVQEVAKSVGLNVEELKKTMNDNAIKQEVSDNYELAKALNLAGTPSFVLSNQAMTEFDFIPGAAPASVFQQALENLAKKQK
jgi:protein-disulfide isomerase